MKIAKFFYISIYYWEIEDSNLVIRCIFYFTDTVHWKNHNKELL